MKRILLSLCFALLSSAPLTASMLSTGWASLGIPLLTPLLCNDPALTDTVADGLNFFHSRDISFNLNLTRAQLAPLAHADEEPVPVLARYQLRWGYKGAGDAAHPFTGINGLLHFEVSYDGFSFHVCKSKKLKTLITPLIAPLVTLSAMQEFYLKLFQLSWTVATSSYELPTSVVQNELTTLLARVALTPGAEQCSFYDIPLVSPSGGVCFADLFKQAPELCTQRFIEISKKCEVLFSLLTDSSRGKEKEQYLALLAQAFSHFNKGERTVVIPDLGSVTLEGVGSGAGTAYSPYTGASLVIALHAPNAEAFEIEMQLSEEEECYLRTAMLLFTQRTAPLALSVFTEELSTLYSRLQATPSIAKNGYVHAILGLLCSYHQSVITYSFDERLSRLIDHKELLLHVMRIGYHCLIHAPANKSPQEIADFAALHIGDGLRCYRPLVKLRTKANRTLQPQTLSKKGIVFDWNTVISTALEAAPE